MKRVSLQAPLKLNAGDPRPVDRPRPKLTGVALSMAGTDSPDRQVLEATIAEKFSSCYGAQLSQFLPHLLCLRTGGELGAIVGIRPASHGDLFVEQYFNRPVEQVTSGLFREPVDRNQIVEIGNLAAARPGSASILFAALASMLAAAGYRWAVCTATPQVVSLLRKLDFPSRPVCRARPTAVVNAADNWGNYYASAPRVLIGDVSVAAARVAHDRQLSAIVRQLSRPIERVAASLRN